MMVFSFLEYKEPTDQIFLSVGTRQVPIHVTVPAPKRSSEPILTSSPDHNVLDPARAR